MPTMRMGTQRRVALFRRALGLGVVIGAVFGGASGSVFRDAPLLGAVLGALGGVINAVLMVGAIFGAEIFLPRTRLGQALERAPFLVTFALKLLVYGAVIVIVVGGRLGRRLALAGADALLGPDLTAATTYALERPTAQGMTFAFLLVGVAIFVWQMSRLVGERTLRDILFGRYHRARTEDRFFLFVDIVGSTPLAERIGPVAVHRFLGEVFRLASDTIDEHVGDVYQYVGDEIVITWTVDEGRARARPLACFFAIKRALDRTAPDFEREFGVVPRLRAALHAGPVVTGEVGGSRRAIVYHGDVMNTTSRIEQATRDLERQFLVSEDALERLDGYESYILEDLGARQLRGRTAAVRIYAVTANTISDVHETMQVKDNRQIE
ncbi:MAG: adenylate/guanylate cyclase domain-containing protein [Nitrobacter sp.]